MFKPIVEKPKDFEPDIFIAAKEGKLSSVQYLIGKKEIGVNKHAEKDYGVKQIFKGCTAINIASWNGHLPVVQYQTPLHVASFYDNTYTVKYLISKGANKNAKDEYGGIPYDYARNEIRELLK